MKRLCIDGTLAHHFTLGDTSTASGGLIAGACDRCGTERTFQTNAPDTYGKFKITNTDRKVLAGAKK